LAELAKVAKNLDPSEQVNLKKKDGRHTR
jgi:hypothetical protein